MSLSGKRETLLFYMASHSTEALQIFISLWNVLGLTFVIQHGKWRTTCKFEWLKKLSKIANLHWNLSNMPNWISGLLIQIYIFPKLTSKKNIKYKNRKQTGNFEIPCTKCLNLMLLFAKVDFSYHVFSRLTFAWKCTIG